MYVGRRDVRKACIYVKDMVIVMSDMIYKEDNGHITYNMAYNTSYTIEKICSVICKEGNLNLPLINLPKSIISMLSYIVYGLLRQKAFHPDRVNKLVISNNIDASKINAKYSFHYGIEKAINDWMDEADFMKNKNIY